MANINQNPIALERKISNPSIIGTDTDNYQLLEKAREINEYLKLDCEPLLFGLFKEGVEPTLMAVMLLPESTMRATLDNAIYKRIIPDYLDIDLQVYILQRKVLAYLTQEFSNIFDGFADDVFTNLGTEKQGELIRLVVSYAYNRKPIDNDFLNDLDEASNNFTDDEISKIMRFFAYSDLCFGNVLFINEFVSDPGADIKHIDAILKLSKTDIEDILDNDIMADSRIPDRIKNAENPQSVYAQHIFDEIQKRYATRALFLKISDIPDESISIRHTDDNPYPFDEFKKFLVKENNDGDNTNTHLLNIDASEKFNIEKVIIRDYIEQIKETEQNEHIFIREELPSGLYKGDFVYFLTIIQRLYYMASGDKFAVIKALMKNNYYSAFDVIKKGKNNLFDALSQSEEALSQETIKYIFSAAETKVNKVLALLNKNTQANNSLMPNGIRGGVDPNAGNNSISVLRMPELESLLGNQDVTDTKHCESVLGPAAYFVDLLDLMKQINVNQSTSLFVKLVERREDLEHINLDCKNALTMLPYIDLVNEVLEDYIADKLGIASVFKDTDTNEINWSTTQEAEMLELEPERDHVNYAVYDEIKNHYAWNQPPFNMWNEELRVYTNALNLDRSRWFELQGKTSEAALEVLNFSNEDITNNLFSGSIDDNLAGSNLINATDALFMVRVEVKKLLEHTDLNLQELKELLDSYFINPFVEYEKDGKIEYYRHTIHFKEKVELSKAYLEFFTEGQAKDFIFSMYQFKRLQEATGWSMPLLDNILLQVHDEAVSHYNAEYSDNTYQLPGYNHVIGDEHLKNIGKIKKVQQDHELSDNEIMLLFGNLDILEYENEQSYLHWIFIDNYEPQQHKDALISIMNDTRTSAYYNEKMFVDNDQLHLFMEYVCRILQFEAEDIQRYGYLLDTAADEPVINHANVVKLIRLWQLIPVTGITENELKAYALLTLGEGGKPNNFNLDSVDNVASTIQEVKLFEKHNLRFERLWYLISGQSITPDLIEEPNQEIINHAAANIHNTITELPKGTVNKEELSKAEGDVMNILETFSDLDANVTGIIANHYMPINVAPAENVFLEDRDFVQNVAELFKNNELFDQQQRIAIDYLTHQFPSIVDKIAKGIDDLGQDVISHSGFEVALFYFLHWASFVEHVETNYPDDKAEILAAFSKLSLVRKEPEPGEEDLVKNELNDNLSLDTATIDAILAEFDSFKNDATMMGDNNEVGSYLLAYDEEFGAGIIQRLKTELATQAGFDDDMVLLDIITLHLKAIKYTHSNAIEGSFTKESNRILLWKYILRNLYRLKSDQATTKQTLIEELLDLLAEELASDTSEVDRVNSKLKSFVENFNNTLTSVSYNLPEKPARIAREFFKKQPISNEAIRKQAPRRELVSDLLNSDPGIPKQEAEKAVDAFLSTDAQFERYKNTISGLAYENAILDFFEDASENIFNKGKDKIAARLQKAIGNEDDQPRISFDDAKSAIDQLKSDLDDFKNDNAANLQSEQTDQLFKERPFIQDDRTLKRQKITEERVAEEFNLSKYDEKLEALVDAMWYKSIDGTGNSESFNVIQYLKQKTNILVLEDIIKELLPAFRFAAFTNLNAQWAEDLAQKAVPVNLYNLGTEGSVIDFGQLRTMVKLFEASPYLINPGKPFTFFQDLTANSDINSSDYAPIDIYRNFKWFNQFVLDMEISDPAHATDPGTVVDRIDWFAELGKLHEKNIAPDNITDWIEWEFDGNFEDLLIDTRQQVWDYLGFEAYKARVKPLRDKLRTKQRNMLVSYILENYVADDIGSPKDRSDLFSYFLLDTQMTPEVYTSRIVQATLSIQLLMQRINMNLEPDVNLTKSDENRWKWMSMYRVWEANRKIFLYPENWLEPELRDDKTPFFKELEKDLNSSEITPEAVETAYHNYFKKLEKISDIEYCQLFYEKLGEYSILHVVGRTRLAPHEYYYRKLINESYWTPWEVMELEIQTEHIQPVVIDDRLFVFWLEMTEESLKPSKNEMKANPDQDEYEGKSPKQKWKVNICWSERLKNEWTPKKMYQAKWLLDPTQKVERDTDGNTMYIDDKMGEKKDFSLNIIGNNLFIVHHKFRGVQDRVYKYKLELFSNLNIRPIGYWIQNFFGQSPLQVQFQKHYKKVVHSLSLFVPDHTGEYHLHNLNQNGLVDIRALEKSNDESEIDNLALNTYITFPAQFGNLRQQVPYVVDFEGKSFIYLPESEPKHFSSTESYMEHVISNAEITDSGFLSLGGEVPEFFTDEDANGSVYVNEEGEAVIYHNQYNTEDVDVIDGPKTKLSAHLAYHPFVKQMRRNLEKFGIEGLLDPGEFDITTEDNQFEYLLPRQLNGAKIDHITFNNEIFLNSNSEHKLLEQFEFHPEGTFSVYNWEVFFHIPYMMANHFYTEGDFDAALKWMHYIFDPREVARDENGSQFLNHFWKFKPFALHNEQTGIGDILYDTNMADDASVQSNEFDKALEIWSNDPFKPHNVARLRISAYMKATIMRYLDIVIARGDQSFRIDTMESINEASQYYIIATQLLGQKPEVLQTEIDEPVTYSAMDSGTMGNAIETLEEAVIKPENAAYMERYVESNELAIGSKPFSKDRKVKQMVNSLYEKLQQTEEVFKLYFGVPKNDKLFGYWNLVGDRLFKIRNSMNIEGVKRSLALFAPPIDPGMLAKAAAAGLSISDVVNGGGAPASEYRFNVLIEQTKELVNTVQALGSKLLSAYEKEDGEMISKLRTEHEILLSEKITALKEKAIEEAGVQIEQLDAQEDLIDFRRSFYEKRERRLKKERMQLKSMDKAFGYQMSSQAGLYLSSMIGAIMLNTESGVAGAFGSPTFNIEVNKESVTFSPRMVSGALDILASIENHKASKAGIIASHIRRDEEWDFQLHMAEEEQKPLKKQKLSAEMRKAMAEKELENHNMQLQQSRDTYSVLNTKYTNQELYNWMRLEISQLQRSAYDMAYKMAKQTEKAYNFELNPGGLKQFVSPAHFDRKYDGILAGEKLSQELKEMEIDYFENNKRKYELTKHVSLAMLDPQQVLELRENGSCELFIPEILFDMDHPGHANRRIKSVSVTIPCVAGPYTSVSAELSLIRSTLKNKQQEVIESKAAISKMATSSAQNDSGLFQLNFNDERYLPFEGAGVDSHWVLSLPNSVRQFDYNTINDVVLTINYTAENAGNRQTVEAELKEGIINALTDSQDSDAASENGNKKQRFAILIDIKNQYPEVFNSLRTANTDLKLTNKVLPYFLKVVSADDSHDVKVVKYTLYDGVEMVGGPQSLDPALVLDETEKSIEIDITGEIENLVMMAEIVVS